MCFNLVYIHQNASFEWNKANVISNYYNKLSAVILFKKKALNPK